MIAGSGGSRQGNHHYQTLPTRVCQPNHFCRFNPALTMPRQCIERWHVCLCRSNRCEHDRIGTYQQANPRGWVQRTLRRSICRNSENTDKPEERKLSGFLLFGSTTALTSRIARRSLGKGPNNERDKCCSASFEASNSTALMRNLRAVLLLRAGAVLWSLCWLLLLSVDDFTGLMVFELLGGIATALTSPCCLIPNARWRRQKPRGLTEQCANSS